MFTVLVSGHVCTTACDSARIKMQVSPAPGKLCESVATTVAPAFLRASIKVAATASGSRPAIAAHPRRSAEKALAGRAVASFSTVMQRCRASCSKRDSVRPRPPLQCQHGIDQSGGDRTTLGGTWSGIARGFRCSAVDGVSYCLGANSAAVRASGSLCGPWRFSRDRRDGDRRRRHRRCRLVADRDDFEFPALYCGDAIHRSLHQRWRGATGAS